VANQSFSAVIAGWTKRVEEAEEAVFKEAVQQLVKELDAQITSMVYDAPPAPTYPRRTGFLRASLVASKDAMPQLVRENPGIDVNADYGDVILTIAGSELGDTIFLGYTAKYGYFVHAGANGRPPKPWVTLVAQRWPAIVSDKAAEVGKRFGLL
jgi:hypothetical protein